MADAVKKSYRCLNGISYPKGKRAEKGDIVDDLPKESVKWLLEQGEIEEVKHRGDSARK